MSTPPRPPHDRSRPVTGQGGVLAAVIVGLLLGTAFFGLLVFAYQSGRSHCMQEMRRQ